MLYIYNIGTKITHNQQHLIINDRLMNRPELNVNPSSAKKSLSPK